ncbi:uncharacterized protein LAESUDRAFT_761987 [Laetiporus sulphureus 93-53]|uniref:Uncharacterized protein n=1 Tax=Laetiporus sulphureus 93-53 TaxID=1314785 RepID=A0A165CTJ1_9APHY|nr:uncharacterized protein LAESUDRAFT_761987 [Laetiporus sulphureus 93-53]KZT03411.1 hypothetical protein LAESUDRAFT_761987 [Laetiporus sulphureus 93-53]
MSERHKTGQKSPNTGEIQPGDDEFTPEDHDINPSSSALPTFLPSDVIPPPPRRPRIPCMVLPSDCRTWTASRATAPPLEISNTIEHAPGGDTTNALSPSPVLHCHQCPVSLPDARPPKCPWRTTVAASRKGKSRAPPARHSSLTETEHLSRHSSPPPTAPSSPSSPGLGDAEAILARTQGDTTDTLDGDIHARLASLPTSACDVYQQYLRMLNEAFLAQANTQRWPPTLPEPSSLAPSFALRSSGLSTATPSGPCKPSSHDFPAIPMELDPDCLMDPPAVIQVIRSGLKTYIPLTALTNDACRNVHRLAHRQKETLKVENGSVTVSLLVLDASREPFLSTAEFQQAYP